MNSILSHVLSIVDSSTTELGIERDSWRFRITTDPRFFMDELKGRAFHAVQHESEKYLRELLIELREEHHFVIPHNERIHHMEGNYLILFSIKPHVSLPIKSW